MDQEIRRHFEALGLEQVRAKIAESRMDPQMMIAALNWVEEKAKEGRAVAWRTETAAWIGACFAAAGFILALLTFLQGK